MRNCKATADSERFKERNHIFRHLLESVGFQLGGLVGAAVSEKVRRHNAITACGEVSDLVPPEVAGAWEAVEKENVGLVARWRYMNMAMCPA